MFCAMSLAWTSERVCSVFVTHSMPAELVSILCVKGRGDIQSKSRQKGKTMIENPQKKINSLQMTGPLLKKGSMLRPGM